MPNYSAAASIRVRNVLFWKQNATATRQQFQIFRTLDIAVHKNEPEEVVSAVRDWLNNEVGLTAAGPAKIWGAFNDFMADNYEELKVRGFSDRDIKNLKESELITCMRQWIKEKVVNA